MIPMKSSTIMRERKWSGEEGIKWRKRGKGSKERNSKEKSYTCMKTMMAMRSKKPRVPVCHHRAELSIIQGAQEWSMVTMVIATN